MPTYIDVPIEVDPDALAQVAFDELQSRIPGWSPAPGNLETILIESLARLAAIIGTIASTVPTSIFRRFGPLVGVLPVEATSATAPTTWTMRDTAGYTIKAGTQVGIRTAGDVLVPFSVLADVVVPPGSAATGAGAVTIVALEPGAAGSGLTGPGSAVELIDTLDYVTAIVQTAETTGGIDAETDAAYLDRLHNELQLLAPRPILPADFAAILESVPGIDRALAIDGYNPGVNEQQTVTVDATAGTFTLTFAGQTTGAIAFNASAAVLQAALEALSNIAPGDVIVTGGPGATAALTVEFTGAYASTDVAAVTANSGSLTGGTHTATIATIRAGVAASSGNARTVTVAAVDESGNVPSGGAIAAGTALLQSEREAGFLVFVVGPSYTSIDVSFTFSLDSGFAAADVEDRAEKAVADFLNPANWGVPATGDQRAWLLEPTVRYNDLAWAIRNVQGVRHVTALTFGVTGGALAGTDVTLAGVAPLPRVGTIEGEAA